MRIEIDDERLILDPPMLECPHCGSDGFYIRGRTSGFVSVHRSMRDGGVTHNEGMWNDVRVQHDDRAYCDACNARIGHVIGCGPDRSEDPARSAQTIRKVVQIVCLAAIRSGRILLLRKRGQDFLILPGGKPEPGESALQTLQRESGEELGTSIVRPKLIGMFRDEAGGETGVDVEITLYAGELAREPTPLAEIDEMHWTDIETSLQDDGSKRGLAPSLANLILPYLAAKARRTKA